MKRITITLAACCAAFLGCGDAADTTTPSQDEEPILGTYDTPNGSTYTPPPQDPGFGTDPSDNNTTENNSAAANNSGATLLSLHTERDQTAQHRA